MAIIAVLRFFGKGKANTFLILFLFVTSFGLDTARRPQPGRRFSQPELVGKDLCPDLLDLATPQVSKLKRTIADPYQPVHSQTKRFEGPPDLAVAAFAKAKGQPGIGALLAIDGHGQLGDLGKASGSSENPIEKPSSTLNAAHPHWRL